MQSYHLCKVCNILETNSSTNFLLDCRRLLPQQSERIPHSSVRFCSLYLTKKTNARFHFRDFPTRYVTRMQRTDINLCVLQSIKPVLIRNSFLRNYDRLISSTRPDNNCWVFVWLVLALLNAPSQARDFVVRTDDGSLIDRKLLRSYVL